MLFSIMKLVFSQYSFLASSSANAFVLLCVLVMICRSSEAVVNLPKNVTVPAVIAFGDSIVDQGNNNVIETIAKCNFPPYGKDFVGGPTGRFCNGKTPADLIPLLSFSLCS
ncbi:hypothetical protein CsSME_00013499 [Camellia sinensis var. sinensis]